MLSWLGTQFLYPLPPPFFFFFFAIVCIFISGLSDIVHTCSFLFFFYEYNLTAWTTCTQVSLSALTTAQLVLKEIHQRPSVYQCSMLTSMQEKTIMVTAYLGCCFPQMNIPRSMVTSCSHLRLSKKKKKNACIALSSGHSYKEGIYLSAYDTVDLFFYASTCCRALSLFTILLHPEQPKCCCPVLGSIRYKLFSNFHCSSFCGT